MVTLQILVLPFLVRVRVAQPKERVKLILFFFIRIAHIKPWYFYF